MLFTSAIVPPPWNPEPIIVVVIEPVLRPEDAVIEVTLGGFEVIVSFTVEVSLCPFVVVTLTS